jgi:hypothetical protein
MIYDTCTLIAPSGATLALGTVTHTATASHGYICELDTSPAPLSLYRADLLQAAGSVVVPGKRQAREITIRGTVLGQTQADLASRWSTLMGFFDDLGGDLLGVRFTVGTVTRTLYGAVDGGLAVRRVTPLAEEFEVTIICPSPLASGSTLRTVTLSAHPGTTAVNAGDGAVPVTFRVAGPSSGTATAVRVGNSNNGTFVEVSGISLTAGGELIIDTTPGRETVLLNDASIAGKVTPLSRWVTVRGTGKLYVTRTAGSGTVTGTAEWVDGWVS